MRRSRALLRRAAVAAALVSCAAASGAGMPAARAGSRPSPARAAGPSLRVTAAQTHITLHSQGGYVTLDPGIWVASLGSALEFHVQRAGYTKPVTITQIIHRPHGAVVRHLPAALKVLRETTTANDISLRKIILGGKPGARTVRVPPWHGIDPEP